MERRSSNLPRLSVLTALWRRPELARLVMRRYVAIARELEGVVELRFMAVGSEGKKSRDLAGRCGWDYVEAANSPLGRKWNKGLLEVRARHDSPDGVVIVGSDDWLNAACFEHYARQLAEGRLFIGFQDIYFLYWKKLTTLYFGGYSNPKRIGEPLGLGRCLSRELLDRLKWEAWWNSPNRGLDMSMTKLIRNAVPPAELNERRDVRRMADVGAVMLDIKTPVGICKVQSYIGSPNAKWDNTSRVLSSFPETERSQLLGLLRSL